MVDFSVVNSELDKFVIQQVAFVFWCKRVLTVGFILTWPCAVDGTLNPQTNLPAVQQHVTLDVSTHCRCGRCRRWCQKHRHCSDQHSFPRPFSPPALRKHDTGTIQDRLNSLNHHKQLDTRTAQDWLKSLNHHKQLQTSTAQGWLKSFDHKQPEKSTAQVWLKSLNHHKLLETSTAHGWLN